MADRVVVMNKGRIEQYGPPEEIYTRPRTHFVAEFVGSNNIFDGKVVDMQDGLIRVQCADAIISAAAGERPPGKGSTVSLVVQADKVRSSPIGMPGENMLGAVLSGREFTGSQVIYYLETASGGEVKMVAQEPFSQTGRAAINMAMQLYWSPADTVVLRPNIVPGVENMPGRHSYVALGT
jgi:spermidine/putrescine transport system ATP-binding protein